jgi:hypothetical protein
MTNGEQREIARRPAQGRSNERSDKSRTQQFEQEDEATESP